MLEKSVLANNDLKKEIKKRYGFNEIETISILKGNANIFKIKCDGKIYVLKEYQSSYKLKDIQKEERITKLLTENSIPTIEIIPCLNSKGVWEFKGRSFILQKFVGGVVLEPNSGSHQHMMESARYLSRINLVLNKIKLEKEDKVSDWLTEGSLLKSEKKYDQIIAECDKHTSDPIFEKIKSDILTKKKLLKEIITNKEITNSITNVTSMNSHGDYSVLQFIYGQDKSKIKAILDFSVAVKLPVVWEVIRSYTYIDPKCKTSEINTKNLIDYVREYTKTVELSKIDLAMMPYVYLIQLLKSPYGYGEYVLKHSENKEQLLKFAFWRTRMCIWLASNAKKLSWELSLLDKKNGNRKIF